MTKTELKTLLDLNGNQRLLYLESAILADTELAAYYRSRLSSSTNLRDILQRILNYKEQRNDLDLGKLYANIQSQGLTNEEQVIVQSLITMALEWIDMTERDADITFG